MKNLVKLATTMAFSLLVMLSIKAQDYKVALQARGGMTTCGIAAIVFRAPQEAYSAILTVNDDATRYRFNIYYQEHHRILRIRGLNYFRGAGLHLGYNQDMTSAAAYALYDTKRTTTYWVGGWDLIFGIEYKMKKLPIVICADMKPYIDLMLGECDWYDGGFRIGVTF